MIDKMSPGSGRMLKENGEYVNIADLLEGITEGARGNLTINDSITLTVGTEAVIEFQTPVHLCIINKGAGVVHISFDEKPADATTFELEQGHSIRGVKCNKLRLYSAASTPTVQYIGGEL